MFRFDIDYSSLMARLLIVLVVVGAGLLAANMKWPPWGLPPLPTPPGLPTIQSVSGKDVNTITLTWSIPTSADFPILKFQVERTKQQAKSSTKFLM